MSKKLLQVLQGSPKKPPLATGLEDRADFITLTADAEGNDTSWKICDTSIMDLFPLLAIYNMLWISEMYASAKA